MIATLIFCFVGVVVAGGVVFFIQVTSQKSKIDPVTYCPRLGPKAVTVVLIDRTDVFTPIQRAALLTRLSDIRAGIPRHAALQIVSVGPIEEDPLRAEFSLCNPGEIGEIDRIVESPARAKKNWEEGFKEPLDKLFRELVENEEASSSPIMESIQSVAVTAFAGQRLREASKTLIVVSDMLQHGGGHSHYSGIPKFEKLQASEFYRRVRSDLRDVEVELLYLRRRTQKNVQGRDHIEFWQRYFSDQGATLKRVVALAG